MKTELHLDTWNRKEHFHFFSTMEDPFFGIVVEIDGTKAYAKAKEQGISFFQYYLYQSLKAANEIECFRYRIEGEQVFCYDVIHAAATIARADGTFGFTFMEYQDSLSTFLPIAAQEIAAVQNCTGLRFTHQTSRLDSIHYSVLPWFRFTGLTHARSFTYRDSVPKISFGKYVKDAGKMMLPVAIYVHHGLMDAYHVGQFVARFQELLVE